MDAEHLRSELDRERQRSARLEAQLQEKDIEIKATRAQWRRAASELNKQKAKSRPVAQLTDQDVVDRVQQLRYEIKSFAFQHFESSLSEARIEDALGPLQRRLRLGQHKLQAYLASPTQRHLTIRAFVWTVLMQNFCEQYRWAGRQASQAMLDLVNKLYPADDEDVDYNGENMQKYRRWRVDTTRLLADVRDDKRMLASEDNMAWFEDLIDLIYRPLKLLSKSPRDQVRAHVATIVHQFLDLDRLLGMQVADYEWLFTISSTMSRFSEQAMTLEEGEVLEDGPGRVALILAPSLVRYGKTTGEDYNQSTRLLRMEVSCRHIRRLHKEPRPAAHYSTKLCRVYDRWVR